MSVAEGWRIVDITGVWRLWPEHPSPSQSQNEAVKLHHDNTNPDHSFEIHPITSINGHSTISTLGRIRWKGNEFSYKDAATAIHQLQSSKCSLSEASDGTVDVSFNKLGNNYIKFKAKLLEKPNSKIEDGFTVQADILNSKGKVLAPDIRLVFVDRSSVAKEVWAMSKNQTITLVAITRISLNLVDSRISSRKNLDATLPYELVALGSFK